MGLMSSIGKITDPGDFFGARSAKAAADSAAALGRENIAMQTDWMNYIKSQSEPFQESALRALPAQEALMGLSGADAQREQIDMLRQSPFYGSMVSQGEDAIARNAQSTGGFRSGTTQQNLAQNSQNVLMGLYDQKLSGLGALSGRGLQSQALGQQGGEKSLAEIGNTFGQIGNIGINQAAQQQNKAMGMMGMAASFFSDKRLKDDIVKIGEKNGFDWYSWDWNERAEELGLSGRDEGHIAQEVQKERPDLVSEKDGYLMINYGGL